MEVAIMELSDSPGCHLAVESHFLAYQASLVAGANGTPIQSHLKDKMLYSWVTRQRADLPAW